MNYRNRLQLNVICWVMALWCGAVSVSAADGYARYYRQLPIDVPVLTPPSIPALRVSLVDYGAVGDGLTLNTHAFAAAIDDLSRRGGGHLDVPEGIWLTGPIVMKSNIDLHVAKNAVVLFSPDRSLYPVLSPDEGTSGSRCQPLLSAVHARNLSITGEGIFDGNGENWRPVKRMKVGDVEWKAFLASGGVEREQGTMWYPWSRTDEACKDSVGLTPEQWSNKRPRMLRFLCCEDVLLQGVVFQNSPSFHVNLMLSHRLIVDGVMVRCPWNAQNGDGIDLSCCTDALVVNCSVDAGDDSICLKSSPSDAKHQRGPCANIVIDHCTVFHGHGGFVTGSNTGGGIYNVSVKNCRFIDTDTGLRFKSGRDRGGCVSEVYVDSIWMNDIAGEGILFESYYQGKPARPKVVPEGGEETDSPFAEVIKTTPVFRNIHISNVTCRDANQAMRMTGLPEQNVQDITLSHCTLHARYGVRLDEAERITLDNVRLHVEEGSLFICNNAKDITVKGLQATGDGNKLAETSGSRGRNIRIQNSSLPSKQVSSTPRSEGIVTVE